MDSYRILVTGSRDWPDLKDIWMALSDHVRYIKVPIVLISGGCPTGADRMAESWASMYKHDIERHPADWDTHGKRAGFIRNSEMVSLGAHVCFAFIKDESKGATMTRDLAIKAGITTYTHTI